MKSAEDLHTLREVSDRLAVPQNGFDPLILKGIGELAENREDVPKAVGQRGVATTQSVIRDIQASGVTTLAGIARLLELRGIRTPAGRTGWQPVQVARLLS
jgi:hypothetical protein